MPLETTNAPALRRPSLKRWWTMALAAFFGLPFIVFHGFGAFDAFLKIDGVDGESTDEKHKNEIEIQSFSWGVTNTRPTAGGGGTGKVTVQDFHFTKRIDKSSPLLFMSCCTGKHIPTAIITCRKTTAPGANEHVYLKIELENILVSSYGIAGDTSRDILPVDSLSMNFTKMTWTYIPLDSSGQPGSPVTATVDFSQLPQ